MISLSVRKLKRKNCIYKTKIKLSIFIYIDLRYDSSINQKDKEIKR